MDADSGLSLLFHLLSLGLFTFLHGVLLAGETLIEQYRHPNLNTPTETKIDTRAWNGARERIHLGLLFTSWIWVWSGYHILSITLSPLLPGTGFFLIIATIILLSAYYRLQRGWKIILTDAKYANQSLQYIQRIALTGLHFFYPSLRNKNTAASSTPSVGAVSMEKVTRFNNRMVREIMVPRVDMICLYDEDSWEENQHVMRTYRHIRYPVCEKEKDRVLGIVHIHDIYDPTGEKQNQSLRALARPEVVVPETMDLAQTLRTLQEKRAGMAIVVDEYGGTAGMVTTEDITEEIFGDIQDEFDQSPQLFIEKGDAVLIHPRALITEVNDYFGLAIEDEGNDTIGGWLFSQLEKVPEKGDRITHNHIEFIVEKAHDRWIDRLLVQSTSEQVHPEQQKKSTSFSSKKYPESSAS